MSKITTTVSGVADARNSANTTNKNMQTASNALITGKAPNRGIQDILPQMRGEARQTEANSYDFVIDNISSGINTLEKARNGLQEQAKALNGLEASLLNAEGKTGTDLQTIKGIFEKQMEAANLIAPNTIFDGKNVLTDLSGQSKVVADIEKGSVVTRSSTVPTGGATGFAAAPTTFSNTTIVAASVVANNTITFTNSDGSSTVFTCVTGTPTNDLQIQVVTGDNNVTARNIAAAIVKYDGSPDLKNFKVEVANATVTLTKFTGSSDVLLVGSTGGTLTVTNNGGAASIVDASGVKNNPAFTGTVVPNFKVISGIHGANAANLLTTAPGGVIDAESVEGDPTTTPANNNAVSLQCKIGEFTYNGGLFISDGTNQSPANSVIVMKSDGDGGSFKIKLGAANTANGLNASANNGDVVTNGGVLVGLINTAFTNMKFTQEKQILLNNEINVSNGDIKFNGNTIATTEGVKAFLRSENLNDLNFTDFTVKAGAVAGQVDFKATISGADYTVTGVAINSLVKGQALTLLSTAGDNLIINLGEDGLTNMTTADQMSAVQEGFKKMFGIGAGITVKTGLGKDNSLKVEIANMDLSKILTDDSGSSSNNLGVSYAKGGIDISTTGGIAKAKEAIANAKKANNAQLASVNINISILQDKVESATKSQELVQKAASQDLKADVVEENEEFRKTLNDMQMLFNLLSKFPKIQDAIRDYVLRS